MNAILRQRFEAQPIWLRLALVALLTGAIAVASLAGIYRHVHEDFGTNEFVQEGEALVRVALAGALEPVITEDRAELETIVEVLARSSRAMSRIRILNERGDLLAGWNRKRPANPAEEMVFRRDVQLAGERFGRIELTLDSSRHDLAFRRHQVELSGFTAIGIFAVVVILLLFVHLQVVRPIQRMESRLQAQGAFRRRSPRAFRHQPREIAMLQQAVSASVMHARASARRHAELQSAHESAAAASRAKARFLATMSHELRSPLAAMTGALQVLRDGDDPARARQLAGEAVRAADAMRELVDAMLEFAGGDDGPREPDTEFEPSGCLASVGELFALECAARGIRLETRVDAACPARVRGPEMRVRQVLMTLVSNAVKFTRDGSVQLAVAPVSASANGSQRLRFSVTDSGPGIEAADQQGLFEEFRQVQQDYARAHGGAGLGLALARRIVERIGGDIGVDSQPGTGSTFWFECELEPCAAPVEPQPLPAITVEPAADAVRGLRVLVVDDSDANRMVAAAILAGLGCVVTECSSGAESVGVASAATFDVILMDLQMPGMDGFEACRRIIAAGASKAVILALSANSSAQDRAAADAAGMAGLIAKPADRASLLRALHEHAPRCSVGTEAAS